MEKRTELHSLLCKIMEDLGYSAHVYYQPPETVKMVYPAIVYSRSNIDSLYAGDNPYRHNYSYEITVIEKKPESKIAKVILDLPYCNYNRHYIADNLNHDTFTIYF